MAAEPKTTGERARRAEGPVELPTSFRWDDPFTREEKEARLVLKALVEREGPEAEAADGWSRLMFRKPETRAAFLETIDRMAADMGLTVEKREEGSYLWLRAYKTPRPMPVADA